MVPQDNSEKPEDEIMRDMNATLKRMHKMGAKPHSEMKVGKADKAASSKTHKSRKTKPK
jgi:hypothetical protein